MIFINSVNVYNGVDDDGINNEIEYEVEELRAVCDTIDDDRAGFACTLSL